MELEKNQSCKVLLIFSNLQNFYPFFNCKFLKHVSVDSRSFDKNGQMSDITKNLSKKENLLFLNKYKFSNTSWLTPNPSRPLQTFFFSIEKLMEKVDRFFRKYFIKETNGKIVRDFFLHEPRTFINKEKNLSNKVSKRQWNEIDWY